jgi:hypothetical protein
MNYYFSSGLPLALLIFTLHPAQAAQKSGLSQHNFLAWPKSEVRAFGCFLEKTFKHRDSKFNCSLKEYKNAGDPCKNTQALYEGPQFPENKAKDVDPLFTSIRLNWEHGELQAMTIQLKTQLSEDETKKRFHLPESASVQECRKNTTCIVLTSFDHMGAGDVDCGE